ncbi:hypothetical protein BpHYR1_004855 [Brachionus plicatilis]|uniref:Protein capicua homolog-like C-terminal tri-helical domain-containing protein n=1 Tax=Brachionus plicatilis TaxID=10195 RepID=A0A3M7SYR3_BRAPC|nr:hypothetical protein BpHYR1_004855 [Brachionus plicatilis]
MYPINVGTDHCLDVPLMISQIYLLQKTKFKKKNNLNKSSPKKREHSLFILSLLERESAARRFFSKRIDEPIFLNIEEKGLLGYIIGNVRICFHIEIMNEFLNRNKDLFSNKREFLTKLREVRQKIMNNGKTTDVPIKMANHSFDNQIDDLNIQKAERFYKSNIVLADIKSKFFNDIIPVIYLRPLISLPRIFFVCSHNSILSLLYVNDIE